MTDKTFLLDNGQEIGQDTYVASLRKAWAIYGALVADGCLPAYNLDGGEKVQLAKWHLMHDCISAITTALATLGGDTLNSNFAVWEQENTPTAYTYARQCENPRTVEDEDFPDPDPLPTDKDEPVSERELGRMEMAKFIDKALDALAEQGYYLTKDEPEAPDEKPAGKGKSKGKKSKE